MSDKSQKKDAMSELAQKGKKVLLYAVLLSAFFHLLSYVNLTWVANSYRSHLTLPNSVPVQIRIVDKKKKDDTTNPEEQARKKIVEVIQNKTERPDEAKYSSFQDHKTEKETRMDVREQEKAKNAGKKGMSNEQAPFAAPPQPEMADNMLYPKLDTLQGGTLAIPTDSPERRKKRERYQKLMPTQKDLAGMVDAGFQQHLDEAIHLGDTIDINTSEYRYMGYFSMMRKAIELVWNYPMDAVRRGMQGEVGVEFVIHKEGRISRVNIFKSSGYKLLDDAIVEAVKLASPFAPIPEGFGKDKMKITGSFRYILSPYMAGAH